MNSPWNCICLKIVGPSGSGKTLTLRVLAGLLRPDAGFIRLAGETLFDAVAGVDVPVRERRIGYMFQDYALFPHLSVADNVAFGLAGRFGRRSPQAREQVARWLEFFGIGELAERRPSALSGGQRQRMAIARAVVKKPEIYLFDDSFSALDVKTDKTLRMRLRESMGDSTMLIVAQRVGSILDADRILVMEDGQIVGRGKHRELLHTCPLYREIAELQLGEEEVKHELECV